eukprot:2899472-Lingulodinium_polyedra.AAC.1
MREVSRSWARSQQLQQPAGAGAQGWRRQGPRQGAQRKGEAPAVLGSRRARGARRSAERGRVSLAHATVAGQAVSGGQQWGAPAPRGQLLLGPQRQSR